MRADFLRERGKANSRFAGRGSFIGPSVPSSFRLPFMKQTQQSEPRFTSTPPSGPSHRFRRGRQIAGSLGIVALAVFNSAETCPDPVSADETTVVASMSLTDWGTTFVGDTVVLGITAQSPGGQNLFLSPTWAVSNAVVATRTLQGESCDSKVECAAFAITAIGTSTITATAASNRGRTSSGGTPTASTTLTALARPTRVRILGMPTQILVGETVAFNAQLETATGTPVSSLSLSLSRSVLDTSVAAGEAADDRGPTRVRGVAPGLARVRVSLDPVSAARFGFTGPAFTDEVTVRVLGPAARVVVTPTTLTLRVLERSTANAVVVDAAGNTVSGATLSAVSGAPAQLTALASDNGIILLEPLTGTTSADTTIRVTIRATQNGVSTALGILNVRILPRVAAVTLTPTTAAMVVGQSQQVSAAVTYLPGLTTSPAALVVWRSDNSSVAEVSPSGLVTARTAGETTIRAFAEGVPAAVPTVIRVVSALPTITVAPQATTIGIGGTAVLSAVVTNGQAPIAVNFLSRDTLVATVTASGVVTGVNNGGTYVVASYTLGSTTVRDSARITVATPVADMVLDPLELSVPAGTIVQYQARLLDANGRETSPANGFRVTYVAATSAIAEVTNGDNTTGRITAKTGGFTQVIAYYAPSSGGTPLYSATANLSVGNATAGSVAAVRITNDHLLASVGVSFGWTAEALDASGNTLSGVTFRWSSSNAGSTSINAATGMSSANVVGGSRLFATAVLPNGNDGPRGVTASTVRPAGAVLGTVNVPSGTGNVPAVGATLRAFSGGTPVGAGVVTAAGATPGRAYIPGLIAGTYTVMVSLPGYATRIFTGVVVTSGSVTPLTGTTAIVLVPIP